MTTTPATQALLPVTQLAREAVAKQVEEAFYDECEYAQEMRQGLHDSDPNLQHFARFERDILASQAHSLPGDVGMREALHWLRDGPDQRHEDMATAIFNERKRQFFDSKGWSEQPIIDIIAEALAALTPSAPEKCSTCHGTGTEESPAYWDGAAECSQCEGTGIECGDADDPVQIWRDAYVAVYGCEPTHDRASYAAAHRVIADALARASSIPSALSGDAGENA